MNVFHETGPEVTESRVYCGHIRLHFPSVPKAATHNFILASLSLSPVKLNLEFALGPMLPSAVSFWHFLWLFFCLMFNATYILPGCGAIQTFKHKSHKSRFIDFCTAKTIFDL